MARTNPSPNLFEGGAPNILEIILYAAIQGVFIENLNYVANLQG